MSANYTIKHLSLSLKDSEVFQVKENFRILGVFYNDSDDYFTGHRLIVAEYNSNVVGEKEKKVDLNIYVRGEGDAIPVNVEFIGSINKDRRIYHVFANIFDLGKDSLSKTFEQPRKLL